MYIPHMHTYHTLAHSNTLPHTLHAHIHLYTHFHTHAHMPVHMQISYGSSSPTLSDRDMFPTFFRTIPSETQSNSARFALMKRYNWTKVATLHETRNVFTLVSWTVYSISSPTTQTLQATVPSNQRSLYSWHILY